eukprot:2194824-Amphidinium_carterae.1
MVSQCMTAMHGGQAAYTNKETANDPMAKEAMDKEYNKHKTIRGSVVGRIQSPRVRRCCQGREIQEGDFPHRKSVWHRRDQGPRVTHWTSITEVQRQIYVYVFQSNNVKDQDGNWATFRELGASPASMEASKFVDFIDVLPGNTIMMQSDAEMADVQATLKGCNTWVRLPLDRWPDSWKKYRDPIVPLIRALYGHPDSGGPGRRLGKDLRNASALIWLQTSTRLAIHFSS